MIRVFLASLMYRMARKWMLVGLSGRGGGVVRGLRRHNMLQRKRGKHQTAMAPGTHGESCAKMVVRK